MIKVRAEVKDNDVVRVEFECEGDSFAIMQELICIIGHVMSEMEPVEGATVEDMVRTLPEVVIESMRLNGVLENEKK